MIVYHLRIVYKIFILLFTYPLPHFQTDTPLTTLYKIIISFTHSKGVQVFLKILCRNTF